jgi:hypothetical protein
MSFLLDLFWKTCVYPRQCQSSYGQFQITGVLLIFVFYVYAENAEVMDHGTSMLYLEANTTPVQLHDPFCY